MKKILPFVIVGILVISGLGAVGITSDIEINNEVYKFVEKTETTTVAISQLSIDNYDAQYLEVNLQDTSTYLMTPGNPVLPKVVKTFELPFGVTDVNIEVKVNNIDEIKIEKEIYPAPPHMLLTEDAENVVIKSEKNLEVYESEELYPSNWYDYRVSCGLNDNNERATHVAVQVYPVKYSPKLGELFVAEDAEIKISYKQAKTSTSQVEEEYDMVIIAPRIFSIALNKLVRHKNNMGIKTFLTTTQWIYRNYNGVDKPEEIKLFINDTIVKHNITYVLLVGGLKSKIWGNPRENTNYGAKDWYVPVRYHNFFDNPEHPLSYAKIFDPGVISDLYYADVYKEGGIFEDWDPNGDGIIGAWNYPDKTVENDTIDMYPDVCVGRLACQNVLEVKTVVNKIINYEKNAKDKDWFKKAVVISGDGFMDQEDLDFQWDTNGLPDGNYTIIAQSRKPDFGPFGEADVINITIDRTKPTSLSFNHDDYLRIKAYPDEPIAEIVSVSAGDVLGFNDTFEEIDEGRAYGNSAFHWADINYTGGILHIRGKTYDPSPYGNVTNIHVWVLNEMDEIVFDDWRNGSEMYYEGEWVTGEKTLEGGGGALYYLPEEFEREIVWASNGKLTGPDDIISAISKGCGFAFLSGHGSPNVWADHFPGIPGNRGHGSIPHIAVMNIKINPFCIKFDLNRLRNYNKLPIVLIGGCHNSQFNISMISGLRDKNNSRFTWSYGTPLPDCFSWHLVSMPMRGAIATIGNTGLGYGVPGKTCLIEGLDGGICIEFFKQYRNEYDANNRSAILGQVYLKTLQAYHDTFDMDFLDHAKSLTQWELLGDPSLMIGGYP